VTVGGKSDFLRQWLSARKNGLAGAAGRDTIPVVNRLLPTLLEMLFGRRAVLSSLFIIAHVNPKPAGDSTEAGQEVQ
jgi:hypothetical protein